MRMTRVSRIQGGVARDARFPDKLWVCLMQHIDCILLSCWAVLCIVGRLAVCGAFLYQKIIHGLSKIQTELGVLHLYLLHLAALTERELMWRAGFSAVQKQIWGQAGQFAGRKGTGFRC